ncbi:hypothetical protein SO694_001090106 [Aureococcus anophagefferens]|uniref:Uncharacterized protein n=1 Tax=Aureococcus anophagefferens TaxID=44056 RepID=A0ABR1FM68_AURAN
MADAEAKERLLGLLGYVKDMSAPSESEPCKDLASAPIVVHEALLRDVAGAGAVEFEGPCGAWLRVRRPEATGASRQSAAGKRGARRGRSSSRRFAGVGAALWPMPGVAGAGQIVPELETCGRDYGLLGRRREAPSPFDRTRGGRCCTAPRAPLGPDGVLVDGPHAAPVPSKPAAAPAPDRPTGEPATEVLRKKLPDGIRELCVSLGSGDGGSFRRLEAAVEYLADTVAAAPCAPERELRAAADRARQRHDAARAELDAFDAEDARARARRPPDLAADLGCHATTSGSSA